jgi:acetyl esterase/lipase
MTSHDLVDPDLRPLLEAWPAVSLSEAVLVQVRARILPLPSGPDEGVTVDQHVVAGSEGAPELSVQVYRPAELRSRGCIYHIHGGGFVTGKASDFSAIIRPLAASLGCMIVSVDYRLAPETPHPGPIEDCYAGWVWTRAHCADHGLDPTRIGVMGESAGGGLAASLALLARDRKGPPLAFQCLTYPMLDDRTGSTRMPHAHTGEHIWTAHNNRFGWHALLGAEPGGNDVSCYAAAARVSDVTGLPPTFISTGALDLFLGENIDYAARLLQAGIPCELHVYPGAFHGFDMAPEAPVAVAAREARRAYLQRMIG